MTEKEMGDMDQVKRFLKTQELYDPVVEAMVASGRYTSITEARGQLDRIFSMGKIEGRLVSHDVHGHPVSPREDRLIEDWLRIVESD